MSQNIQNDPNPFTVIGNAKTSIATAISSVRALKQQLPPETYTLLAMHFVANVHGLIGSMLLELNVNDTEESTNGE